jgi:hypothetical protein
MTNNSSKQISDVSNHREGISKTRGFTLLGWINVGQGELPHARVLPVE